MRHISFNSFQAICAEQGAQIHPRIESAVARNAASETFCYAPTEMSVAVAEAGMVLRKYPTETLTDMPLKFPHVAERDVAAAALFGMVRASHRRVATAAGRARQQSQARLQTISTCAEAESGFIQTIAAAEDIRRPIYGFGYQIIAEDDDPLFLRKSFGLSPSGLALRPFTTHEVTFPAGSIVRIDMAQDCTKPDGPVSPFKVDILPVRDIRQLVFARLSSFAFAPQDRPVFADVAANMPTAYLESASRMTMDQMYRIVQRRMALEPMPAAQY